MGHDNSRDREGRVVTKERQRVLIISHGHPELMPGGGEHTAYALFKELAATPGVSAVFLARHAVAGHPGTPFALHTPDGSEVLLHSNCDTFRFSQRETGLLCKEFREFLERFRPTVVHLHHYLHLGVEMLREIRNYSRSVPIVLTLHEYLAICNRHGQMVKAGTEELCLRASPAACHGCFPHRTPEDFFLRELYLKSFFSLVDTFVSPSQFLIDRYVAWGLPQEKFVLIENGLPIAEPAPPRKAQPNGLRNRFAFFGQLNPYKGLQVLLEAMAHLPRRPDDGEGLTLDIHGTNLTTQSGEYKERISTLLRRTRRSVRMYGPYRREDLPTLMAGIDWVVLPSIWWENSPLVIQEAWTHGRPVICSNIGGMAEKVKNGETGLHFRVANSRHLAERLVEAATTPGLWESLRANIRPPLGVREVANSHLEIYDRLTPQRRTMTPNLRVV
jgi:glycosyltransferase involved in cell wall biosynthesis